MDSIDIGHSNDIVYAFFQKLHSICFLNYR